MKLTAKQLKHMDEINADYEAADRTLRIALNYHSNRMNQLAKENASFWKDLGEVHGFDQWDGVGRMIRRVDGGFEVTVDDDPEAGAK